MPVCSNCEDRGFKLMEVDGEEMWVPCDCRKKKDAQDILNYKLDEAGIPRHFVNYTLETYKASEMSSIKKTFNKASLETLENYINNPDLVFQTFRTLWIWGRDISSGHTTLAILLGISMIKHGYSVRYLEMAKLIEYFTKFEEKENFFTELQNYQVYILNDSFDRTRMDVKSDYTKIQLFQFLNDGINNNKYFIMTSNVNVSEISNSNDTKYEQCRILLQRSIKTLEFQGTIKGSII